MEPAHAQLEPAAPQDAHGQSLRLTGDILRGMQVGKTTRGICSRCNATIWLSARRPVKARCPVCGFSRVLS
jgi:DNA-directed RNA polymerase subunit RPC12/RpoP